MSYSDGCVVSNPLRMLARGPALKACTWVAQLSSEDAKDWDGGKEFM